VIQRIHYRAKSSALGSQLVTLGKLCSYASVDISIAEEIEINEVQYQSLVVVDTVLIPSSFSVGPIVTSVLDDFIRYEPKRFSLRKLALSTFGLSTHVLITCGQVLYLLSMKVDRYRIFQF